MSPHVADPTPDTDEATTSEQVAHRRHDPEARVHVRASDIEPYIGLRYLSKLFRFMAIILVLLLVAEVITGLVQQGRAAIPTLLGEMSRLIVLAGLLWGTGDLAILLIDIGHDVRATRILMGRQIAHHVVEDHAPDDRGHHAHHEHAHPSHDTGAHRRATEITTR
jgi:hypothetical protein